MVIILSSDKIWLSHRENKWKIGWFGKFSWTTKSEMWDWDNCTIDLARSLKDNSLIVVVRSTTNKNSSYMGNKPVELRFMLGFSVNGKSPPEPKIESSYTARKNLSKKNWEGPKDRWVLQLDDDHWIWQWAEDGKDISSSETYTCYRSIIDEIEHPKESDNIFDVELESQDDRVIPVIYQPAVDALKNFVREVHCAEGSKNADGSYEVDVSIVFENERLRRYGILNSIYEVVRLVLHGRTRDIESFKIRVKKDVKDNTFTFEGIYSDSYKLNRDNIHGDKPPPIKKHEVKYFFQNRKHPIVFVNTSNHAMAEHDTNNRLWKWEYVPWQNNAPIKLGTKTREELEHDFRQH